MAAYKYFVGLVFFCLSAFTANAQILANGSDHTDNTILGMPIYVYFTDIDPVSDRLQASSIVMGQLTDFIWEKFDGATLTYTHLKTDNAVLSSILNNLSPGGYRLIREDAISPRDTAYAWVLLDRLEITGIIEGNTCEALALVTYHSARIMYTYYDLTVVPEEQIYFSSKPKISWTTVPADIYDGLGLDDSWKNPQTTISQILETTRIADPPPLVAATYTAVITNDFGNSSAPFSTSEIPAVAVYPIMKAEEQKNDGAWVETTELKGSALYKLRFDHSESKNANTYTWIGYNSYDNIQTRDAALWTYSTSNPTEKAYVKYTYMGEELDGYIPGRYRDSLIVSNTNTGCRAGVDLKSILGDDSSLPFIIVEPSKFDPLSLPNVFTPNGDGINDMFKFVAGNEPVSMKTMNLRIFDRAGKELYKYVGRVVDWKGWNGKIKGTRSDCPVGVYYYEISGTGWDDKSYSGKPYRGFVHLFKD
ncbi:MAG: gliding motility-associated C-terminal domain-containing protein [Prevotellaceae bacterium]|jgi:gliding motility-associated-like protein|nr:gliding motility-associated C-terminal domain-containing protein [Prevotellaceae bacterium]